MISREKLFVVASNIDDSIKAITPIYDITIFPDYLKLEKYVETTPVALGSIVISERELPFASSNMSRLIELLDAPFLRLSGKCIYLIDNNTSKKVVQDFLDDNNIKNIICYQGDLSAKFISDVISGAARIADETETEIITYRMRSQDYITQQNIKKYESDEGHYETDEDELSEVPPIDEPEPIIPTVDIVSNSYYIVGKQSIERSLFAFIEAQYLALNGKTIFIESDIQYHTLTDVVLHSTVPHEYIDIEDILTNVSNVLGQIRNSGNRLIFVGCKSRINFDYNFVYDILYNNLMGFIDFFVKECDFIQTPYGSFYNVICGNTVPEILECVNSLKYDVDETKVTFIGMQSRDLGAVNVTSKEMTDIVQLTLGKNALRAEVMRVDGIMLKGDSIVYDIFSLISRGNERQGGGV